MELTQLTFNSIEFNPSRRDPSYSENKSEIGCIVPNSTSTHEMNSAGTKQIQAKTISKRETSLSKEERRGEKRDLVVGCFQ